jgi:hypothetical protein
MNYSAASGRSIKTPERIQKRLKKGKNLNLLKEELNFNKCIKCSIRYYYKHKAGAKITIFLPYQEN